MENSNEELFNQEASNFLPANFPKQYPNGAIPLRVQIFNNKKILRNVLKKPKKGVYTCSHCSETFSKFCYLLDHIDKYNLVREFKCSNNECPYKIVGFSKLRQLRRHELTIHLSNEKCKCHYKNCEKLFTRMDLLNRHIKTVHNNKESRFNRKNNSTVNSFVTGPGGSVSNSKNSESGSLTTRNSSMFSNKSMSSSSISSLSLFDASTILAHNGQRSDNASKANFNHFNNAFTATDKIPNIPLKKSSTIISPHESTENIIKLKCSIAFLLNN